MPLPDVDTHPEAILEARAAREWYAERDTSAAGAFMAELDRGVALISERPTTWPRHLHGTRRYLPRRFPYGVIYRESAGSILIVAVAHCKRRPGYWKNR